MKVFVILFGLSSGIMVGAGVVAILILIGIVPRMAQITKTKLFIGLYEKLLILGTFLGSLISLQGMHLDLGRIGVLVSGLAYGIFIGFLSSGLTEVLDYIPIVSRRLKIPTIYLKYIVIAMLIGKVIGSFLGWRIIQGG